jgi:hypothetical protein
LLDNGFVSTFPRQQIDTATDGDLYSVLLEVTKGELGSFVREFNHSAFVRELSVQLWSVNQGTTEAEEVTDSYVRTKSVTQKRRHS